MGKSFSKNPSASRPTSTARNQAPTSALPRDDIHNFDDPYIPDQHLADGSVCTGCGAVYRQQHWAFDDRQRDLLVSAGVAREVTCPGCRKIAERNPQGIVTLHGDYWTEHREDILNLIRNEEARGMGVNPLERISELREGEGKLVVETTTTKLAQRIGRAIHKAHSGELELKWSGDNQLVRVEWERRAKNHAGP